MWCDGGVQSQYVPVVFSAPGSVGRGHRCWEGAWVLDGSGLLLPSTGTCHRCSSEPATLPCACRFLPFPVHGGFPAPVQGIIIAVWVCVSPVRTTEPGAFPAVSRPEVEGWLGSGGMASLLHCIHARLGMLRAGVQVVGGGGTSCERPGEKGRLRLSLGVDSAVPAIIGLAPRLIGSGSTIRFRK